jgi:hypothetical protein
LAAVLSATLSDGDAVLAFPYDDTLRLLLRAIPGRRWDPDERVWRVPLEPDGAEALARIFEALAVPPQLSPGLTRVMERRRAQRDSALVSLVRPDADWWLSAAGDAPQAVRETLLSHPRAREEELLGRVMAPLDELGLQLVPELVRAGAELTDHLRRTAAPRPAREPAPVGGDSIPRPPVWRGTIDAGNAGGQPAFVLIGEPELLPEEVRAHAVNVHGGVAVPLTAALWELLAEVRSRAWVAPAARRCAAAVEGGRAAPAAVLELSRAHAHPAFVLAPGHAPELLSAFAALPGAQPGAPRGEEHLRLPALPRDPFAVPQLDAFLGEHDVWVEEEDALPALQEIREEHTVAAGIVALSAAHDAPFEAPAGLGGELKPFQRAGVAYVLERRRTFLADEQGLGKTIEALAALEADGAFPAVVLCPASLKLNWLREIERWLPGRSAQALSGTSGPLAGADITVVNYDIAPARAEQLSALAPRALVLDESHYCKNPRAKRTQAVTRIAASVPREGIVLALSGTPVVNRAPELVAQLRILGRLGDFGSGAEFGRRFRGADAELRLHWHLRARCFARRLKADVLPQLPAKTRSIVPVELDNGPEYRLAERDVVAWLQSQPLDLRELDVKVAAALRAERLVRLNALKLLAARGKLHAALAWIHDFSRSGEPLVVFARHREVQQAVLERFPHAHHILGADTPAARDAAVTGFQAGGDLIICSLDVAGQGLTLTRASNVAFLELDWTPARHEQAEDRCHRIGQRDAVTAWYLLAAATIDETLAELLERKRSVIGAVTDGAARDDDAVLDALVRELRGEPYRRLRAVA